MNLTRLKYFLTVVDEGSISAAAQKLHMTQPPLSQAIRAFEAELGVTLLERLPRGVAPTPAGRQLARDGARLVQRGDEIAERTRALGSGTAGVLRVASVPTFSWSRLPPLLRTFRETAPGVAVDLSDPFPARVLDLVSEGRVDIGFVATSDVDALAANFPALTMRGVATMPLAIAVPPGRANMGRAELEAAHWVIPSQIPGFPGLVEISQQLWDLLGIAPGSVQQVSTLQTALPLVAADLAVALMPLDGVGVVWGAVNTVPVPRELPPLYGVMVRSALFDPGPTLEVFLDVVDAAFAEARAGDEAR